MLTRKTITKARENATLTGKGRVILRNPATGIVFDAEDTESVAERIAAGQYERLATVSWDGEVEKTKGE